MPAVTVNLEIEQGATFSKNLIWLDENDVPVNLTGYTGLMYIKSDFDAEEPYVRMSTEAGTILLSASGNIELLLQASTTEAITWTTGIYDLKLTDTSNVSTRLTKGTVTVSKQVSKFQAEVLP